jgi:uncharacterized protein with von Willebrand factor type A (vWA) domain
MAEYDDAAYDDELADDWEAALETEDQADAEKAAEEKEREEAKALRNAKKKQRTNTTEGDDAEDATVEAAGDMQAQALDQAAAADLYGTTPRVALAQRKFSSADERAEFVKDLVEQFKQHQTKTHYTSMVPTLFKAVLASGDTDSLSDLSRVLKIASTNVKSAGPTGPSTRGRNVDLDAFEGVTDRGGAAVTEHEDFM